MYRGPLIPLGRRSRKVMALAEIGLTEVAPPGIIKL